MRLRGGSRCSNISLCNGIGMSAEAERNQQKICDSWRERERQKVRQIDRKTDSDRQQHLHLI